MTISPKVWRLLAAAAVLVTLYIVARVTGLLEGFDLTSVRQRVQGAGAWGGALYVGLFTIGLLVQVPGMIFVAVAILVYGSAWGFSLALIGSVVAVTVSFVVVRGVGGQALANLERPLLRRVMATLERRPLITVVVLRLVFWLGPPVNYALALSPIRMRDYVIGSTLGLVPPLLAATAAFDWLFARGWFG